MLTQLYEAGPICLNICTVLSGQRIWRPLFGSVTYLVIFHDYKLILVIYRSAVNLFTKDFHVLKVILYGTALSKKLNK